MYCIHILYVFTDHIRYIIVHGAQHMEMCIIESEVKKSCYPCICAMRNGGGDGDDGGVDGGGVLF